MLQLRAQVPALFTRSKREHAVKNRAIPRAASSPKAKAARSNRAGCTNYPAFKRVVRERHLPE